MEQDDGEVTQLLRRLDGGDAHATGELLEAVYDELHRMAQQLMRSESPEHTLQPTALVNEAFLKLFGIASGTSFEDHRHFLRRAGRAMRSILIDHARARGSIKRGGAATRKTLEDAFEELAARYEISDVKEALEALTELDPELSQLVDLRFFAGFSNEECAAIFSVSTPTIERRFRTARAWLRQFLADTDSGEGV